MLRFIFNLLFNPKAAKGQFGEGVTKINFSLHLPENEYKRFDNVYVPGRRGGVTEIDHIIISRFGVFVVETKNYSGFLYGGEYDRSWTQVFNRRSKNKIGNPLRQNKGHIKYLMEYLGLPENRFHSVICFIGDAVIKTPMPDYVLTGRYAGYILKFKTPILSGQEARYAAEKIAALKAAPSLKSEHRKYLRQRRQRSRY